VPIRNWFEKTNQLLGIHDWCELCQTNPVALEAPHPPLEQPPVDGC
jgi:hypothetical protein